MRRRRRRQLHGAACSTTPRWARGVIGGVVGGLIGGAAGFGVNLINIRRIQQGQEPNLMLPLLLPVLGLAGTGTGIAVGVRKPNC